LPNTFFDEERKGKNRCTELLPQSKVLVLGEFAGGHETLLTKYLVDRTIVVAFIEFLLTRYYKPGMDILRASYYRGGKLERGLNYGSRWGFLLGSGKFRRVPFYALCLAYTVICLMRFRTKFDICLASNIPFPLVGLALRRLGLVEKVIFISVTHFPSPKGGADATILRLFRFIDKLAHNSCDAIWYQTSRMRKVKEQEGFVKSHKVPRILAPIGVERSGTEDTTMEEIERTSVAYVGRLDDDIGLELVIEAFSLVVKKVPNAKFKIIGSGSSEARLRQEVRALGLETNVEFLGFIGDREKVRDILSRCAVGIAPYIPSLDYSMQYADSAKAKEYIECGIPVIITKVPEIAFEIEGEKAGFALNYDKSEIAKAMIKLLTDDKLWRECHKNIKRLAQKYDYRKIYDQAFRASGIGFESGKGWVGTARN